MLTTTHLRRERPTCVEDTVTAFSAFASGRVWGAGAAAGVEREGLRGVVGVGGAGGTVEGSVGREPKRGERSGDLLAKGTGMGADAEGSGSEDTVRGIGGIKATAFSPPPPPPSSAAATAACCDSSDIDDINSESHDTAYSPGNSILTDSRMWIARFER